MKREDGYGARYCNETDADEDEGEDEDCWTVNETNPEPAPPALATHASWTESNAVDTVYHGDELPETFRISKIRYELPTGH